jgi:hypothetical protein
MFFSKKKHGDSYNITNVITLPGWWSGTWLLFVHFIYGIILLIDFNIFQDG